VRANMKLALPPISAALLLGLIPSTFSAQPDLVPTQLLAPAAITNAAFPQVTLVWTVKNQGDSQAIGYIDGLYVSTNATFDNNASPLTSWYNSAGVAPGGSYSLTNNVVLPIGYGGTYYFLFKTDFYNYVQEADETNNVLVSAFNFVTAPPDLAPVSALVSSALSGPPNPTVSLIWSITNQGPGRATAGWADGVFISTNSVLTPDAKYVGYFSTASSLMPGEVFWHTNTVTLPITSSGSYFLFFETDLNNNLFELNVSNNTLTVPIHFLVQPPDLAVLPLLAPTNVVSEQNPTLLVVLGVTNQGAGTAQGFWTDQLFLSRDNVLDTFNDQSLSSSSEYGPVEPGASYWSTNLVQLRITDSGTYYLFFGTDLQNNLLETDLSNNITSLPIKFTILKPDLAPVSFQTPTSITSAPNPSLTLTWGITNQGAAAATGSWVDTIYLSKKPVLDSSAVSIWNQYEFNALLPGDDLWRTMPVQFPVTQSGTYYLIFATDYANSLNESNTNNNVIVKPIAFAILPPNLAPIAFQVPNSITSTPNPTVQFVWGVTNSGSGSATGNWLDAVYLSTDAQLDQGDTQLFSQWQSGSVPAGSSYWQTNSMQVPITQSGTYYLILVVNQNSNQGIFESDYSDNTMVVPVVFNLRPPDLAPITSLLPKTISGAPFPLVTLVFGITNQGIGSAQGQGWGDTLYLSSDPITDPNGQYVASSYEYGPISPGGVLWVTNTARIPVSASGTKYLLVRVNGNHQLVESDYNNNSAIVPINFDIHPPDLAPISLQVPTVLTGPPYPSLQVVWGITNQGTGTALPNYYWSDHLYVSTNPVFDQNASDVLSGIEFGPVLPGDTYWRTNTVQLTITQSGQYYLFIKANANQDLIESDYSNNVISAGFTFTVQPPDLAPVLIQAPGTVTGPPNPSVTYVWGVTNQGTGAALGYPGSWIDAVALSTNSFWDNSAYVIANDYQSGPLAAGAVYWQTNTLRMPVTSNGNYFLLFNTDEFQSLSESDYSNNVVAVPISFTIQPPDLAPIALQIPSVITGAPNPTLTVVWGVTNQGTGEAVGFSAWNDRLYLSSDPVWDWQDTGIASTYETGPIGPGQAYWRTNQVHLSLTQSGTYYLIFRVDDGNTLFESNESNNVVVVPVTFNILPPDLAPIVPEFSHTFTGPPNPVFKLIWGVTNQGSGQALSASPWIDRVYLSRDAKLDWYDPAIDLTYESGPIDPGGVSWQTNSVTFPVVRSGNYYLLFEANSGVYNQLFESDFSNNVVSVPIVVNILRPDLAPIALQLPASITSPPNPTLTLVWGITNQGLGEATSHYTPSWTDLLYVSTNSFFDPSQAVFADYPSFTVPAGGVYWRTNTINLPITQSGTYYFTLQADANTYLFESDYSNNTLTVPVAFKIQPPDLVPVALHTDGSMTNSPNPKVSIWWTVTNQGPGEAQGYWNDMLFFSTNSTFDNTAISLNYSGGPSPVPAGGSYSQTNVFQLPVLQSGNYFLFVLVNQNHQLFESNFNNNLLSIPLTFTILPPDLAPTIFKAPALVTGPPYPTVNLEWGVTNQGLGQAIPGPGANWADRIYLSTSPDLAFWNKQLINTDYRQQLAPGGSYLRSAWIQVPVVTNGTYYLTFVTDADNSVFESDENNNSVTIPVMFQIQRADLVPIALQAPATITSSAFPTVHFTWGVTNQGTGPAQSYWQDGIYLSRDPVLDSSDVQLTYRWENGPLPAGSSYWRSQTLQTGITNSGAYYFLLAANLGQNFMEANTNNNVLAVPVTFNISQPDLAPISFEVPTNVSGPPNPSITVSWGVTNLGPGDILEGTSFREDQIYFSTNSSLDKTTAPVVSYQYDGRQMPAGGVYWKTNDLRLPVLQDGTYYLFLDVNSGSYQPAAESTFTNNVAMAKVSFHISPPDLAPVFFQATLDQPIGSYPSATLIYGITNQGTGVASGFPMPWEISISVIKTNSADGSQSYINGWFLAQTNSIPPSGTYWSTNRVSFPSVQSGTYLLTANIDPYGYLAESNTNNNTISTMLSVDNPSSDVAPVFFKAPVAISAQGNPLIRMSWGVTNQGAGAALSQDWYDRVYFSANSNWDNITQWLGEWPRWEALPAGGQYFRTNDIVLPVQQSGTYYLILVIDNYRSLFESDLLNNVAVIPITFTASPRADLTPEQPILATHMATPPYPTVTFTWGATNQGAVSATTGYGWFDGVYLSSSPVPDGSELFIGGAEETNKIAPGAFYRHTNDITVPVAASGQYYFLFKANSDGALLESDYGNNTAVVPVNFTITPGDLAPIAFYAPASLTGAPNPLVTVVMGITNQGAGTALAAADGLYLSATPTRDSSAKLVASWQRTNSIAPGEVYWLTNTVRLPVGDGGNYYLIFEADSDNVLLESDPFNNVATVPIRLDLSLQPDLVLGNARVHVVTGPPNPTVELVWNEVNNGLGPAVGPWTDSVTLQEFPFATSQLIGKVFENTILPVGVGFWRTNRFTVPVLTNGIYYLNLGINAANDVFELDYFNNSANLTLSFTITNPPGATLLQQQLHGDGSFTFGITGAVGTAYTLQFSTNLVDWVRMTDFVCTNSPTWLTDTNASRFSQRFYRVAPYAGINVSPFQLEFLGPVAQGGGAIALKLSAPLTLDYRIQSSTNLVDWTTVTNFPSLQSSPHYFSDESAKGKTSPRFYRAVAP
jgi:subtilase family serine protease